MCGIRGCPKSDGGACKTCWRASPIDFLRNGVKGPLGPLRVQGRALALPFAWAPPWPAYPRARSTWCTALAARSAGDDPAEMAEVAHLHIHHRLEEIALPVDHPQRGDRAVLLGDRVGDLASAAGSLLAITETRPVWPLALAGRSAAKAAGSQSTSMKRSGVAAKLSSVWHSRVWMVTPLPVVTMPTMRSPGSGWQQPANGSPCRHQAGDRQVVGAAARRAAARGGRRGIMRGARGAWRSSG